MTDLSWITGIFDAQITIGSSSLLVREVVGNLFGLASALGAMRRRVWAWPVGILGNALLFTVFMGSLFGDAHAATLLGQAGRQLMFIAVSIYGWVRWRQARDSEGFAVTPRWASGRTRLVLIATLILGTLALTPLFRVLGSFEPVWSDAWTFVGSMLATWAMAKGLVEFWLIWVAVDAVGVPLLFSAGYYATAFMYLFYGVFTLIGFFVWRKAERDSRAPAEAPA